MEPKTDPHDGLPRNGQRSAFNAWARRTRLNEDALSFLLTLATQKIYNGLVRAPAFITHVKQYAAELFGFGLKVTETDPTVSEQLDARIRRVVREELLAYGLIKQDQTRLDVTVEHQGD